ncbi:MAG: hypothetical protein V4508_02385 [Pseudomonadota bacterium]
MTVTIHQQIDWLESQIRHMKISLPRGVDAGRVSTEHATHKMACAQATLQTLTQLRGIVRGEELPSCQS